MAAKRTRMSASERREQLIAVARGLFAERGFDATSVEEVAARAQVSKPVVYEHFGGKEGLYAVVVDREITTISAAISSAIADPAAGAAAGPEAGRRGPGGSDASGSASRIAERAALALLTYIEDSPDGFRILSAGSDRAAGHLLHAAGRRRHRGLRDPRLAVRRPRPRSAHGPAVRPDAGRHRGHAGSVVVGEPVDEQGGGGRSHGQPRLERLARHEGQAHAPLGPRGRLTQRRRRSRRRPGAGNRLPH